MTDSPPTPWPVYTAELGSPMEPGDDLTVEVTKRLDAICALYGIDRSDPLWERRLMMTLLHRHVDGFQVEARRGPEVDNLGIIYIIDELKRIHKEESGRQPSTDAVVAEMMEAQADNPIIAGMTHARLMRIYSGRKEHAQTFDRQWQKVVETFSRMMASSAALRASPSDSHARLLSNIFHKRRKAD